MPFFQALTSFEKIFDKIEQLSDEKSFSSRVRFLLKDVVDLRRSNWKPRRDVAGPKTIDQVPISSMITSLMTSLAVLASGSSSLYYNRQYEHKLRL